jgi:prepilin-type N-terminal cleavage/methylation domain-containing protein
MIARRGEGGFTLPELLVALVIMGIIGVALTRLFVSQSRFYDLQAQLRRARFVSRTATNAALSDLRMTEATGGVAAASPRSITVRVPYALGVVCANTATQTTVALFPVDSTTYATAGFSGYAWRDELGNYTYVETGATVALTSASACAPANVSVLPNGKVVVVAPPLPAALPAVIAVGTPVFLLQPLTYEFKASAALPGRTALWRTVVSTGQADELVAPFDTTAKFRFFVEGSDTAQNAVPTPLTRMRGVELNFDALSDRAPQGSSAAKKAQAVTAVFFNNALK